MSSNRVINLHKRVLSKIPECAVDAEGDTRKGEIELEQTARQIIQDAYRESEEAMLQREQTFEE